MTILWYGTYIQCIRCKKYKYHNPLSQYKTQYICKGCKINSEIGEKICFACDIYKVKFQDIIYICSIQINCNRLKFIYVCKNCFKYVKHIK